MVVFLALLGLFTLGMGLWMVIAPESAWRFNHFGRRWQYEDDTLEPSENGLLGTRIRGWGLIAILVIFTPIVIANLR